MPVVDHLLKILIKYLQKIQKQRKKIKKKKHKSLKNSRKVKISKASKLILGFGKRKKTPTKRKIGKRIAKKNNRKASFRRKKTVVRLNKKKAPRKPSKRPKIKQQKISKAKKKTIKPSKLQRSAKETYVGEVTHFFSKIKVIVLKMTRDKLIVGDKIHIKGRNTDIYQQVKSLQIESVDVKVARKGQLVGLKVAKKGKVGDKVFKVG